MLLLQSFYCPYKFTASVTKSSDIISKSLTLLLIHCLHCKVYHHYRPIISPPLVPIHYHYKITTITNAIIVKSLLQIAITTVSHYKFSHYKFTIIIITHHYKITIVIAVTVVMVESPLSPLGHWVT